MRSCVSNPMRMNRFTVLPTDEGTAELSLNTLDLYVQFSWSIQLPTCTVTLPRMFS